MGREGGRERQTDRQRDREDGEEAVLSKSLCNASDIVGVSVNIMATLNHFIRNICGKFSKLYVACLLFKFWSTNHAVTVVRAPYQAVLTDDHLWVAPVFFCSRRQRSLNVG